MHRCSCLFSVHLFVQARVGASVYSKEKRNCGQLHMKKERKGGVVWGGVVERIKVEDTSYVSGPPQTPTD